MIEIRTSWIVAGAIALAVEIFILNFSARLAYMGGTISLLRSVMQWGLVFALRAVIFVIIILIASAFAKGGG